MTTRRRALWSPSEVIPVGRRVAGGAMPPLVEATRREIYEWREAEYPGVGPVSAALLRWWFLNEHPSERGRPPFRYHFGQREAVETAIWFHEVKRLRSAEDLADLHQDLSPSDFIARWPRYVLKMATGSGKTKVISLLMAWSWFNRFYDPESPLARNFLLVAPNLIVLERLKQDFDRLNIFREDPVLPEDGFEGRNWKSDFLARMRVHIQKDVRVAAPLDNLFLTNIQQTYRREPPAETQAERLLGRRPVAATKDSKVRLRDVLGRMEELVVFNDEAHHVHDSDLEWFKAIEDLHNGLVQRDSFLSLQLDVTATPRHNDGSTFVETISNYPLAEAIHQGIVKRPVIPDEASRRKLQEREGHDFVHRYEQYIRLGVEEWRRSWELLSPTGKRPVLFLMTDDTKNCDALAEHLEVAYPDLFGGAVLTIHTNRKGDINKGDLEDLREKARDIDKPGSPYKAIVSVLMLREGWDVRSVTTIVGLRSYSAKSEILPEQTVGRGLRLMYSPHEGEEAEESVSVVGTGAFLDFVEKLRQEDVELRERPMNLDNPLPEQVVVMVDFENRTPEDLIAHDIRIPVLPDSVRRERIDLNDLDPSAAGADRIALRSYGPEEMDFAFEDLATRDPHHTIKVEARRFDDHRHLLRYLVDFFMKKVQLDKVGGHSIVFEKMRFYIENSLFEGGPVSLEDGRVFRNLAEPDVLWGIYTTFRSAYERTSRREAVGDEGGRGEISLLATKPFRRRWDPEFFRPAKSVFNYVVGSPRQGGFEREVARRLESWSGVQAYSELHRQVGFEIPYVAVSGGQRRYCPDFVVRGKDGTICIVETKGREDQDVVNKRRALAEWCRRATAMGGARFVPLFVQQERFRAIAPNTFEQMVNQYRDDERPIR